MSDESVTLPPLPEPTETRMGRMSVLITYTEDQMREYARTAVLAERERCAKLCGSKVTRVQNGEPPEGFEGNWVTVGLVVKQRSPTEIAAAIRSGK